jgi:pimeloyl-ACP methyl ester carboxylesterase
VELIAKLQPYDRPFLGVLPLRVARAKDAAAPAEPLGVAIRHVYSNSGADAAGLEPGDRIVSAGGKPTADRAALREVVAALEPGKKVPLQLVRGEQTLNLEIELGTLPEEIPGELPPAIPGRKPYVGQQPPVGLQPIKVAEFQNDCLSYVPESYDPAVPHGVVVWLHEPNGLKAPEDVEKLIGLWKPLCDEHDLILLAPRSQDPARWVPAKELAFLAKVLEQVRATYHVDDLRIAAAGFQAGGSMAFALAFNQRELIRAVAAVDAPLAGQVPDHEPVHPLAFMITTAKQGRVQPQQVEAAAKRLREMKYPVTLIDQGDKSRPLSAEELRNFVRWLDTLDRI